MATAKARADVFTRWFVLTVEPAPRNVTIEVVKLFREYRHAAGNAAYGRSGFVRAMAEAGFQSRKLGGVFRFVGARYRNQPKFSRPKRPRLLGPALDAVVERVVEKVGRRVEDAVAAARPVDPPAVPPSRGDSGFAKAVVDVPGGSKAAGANCFECDAALVGPFCPACNPQLGARVNGNVEVWPVDHHPLADADRRYLAGMWKFAPIVAGEPLLTGYVLPVGDDGDQASARVAHELFVERRRQAAPEEAGGEGWSAAHDDADEWADGQLARAGAAYAFAASLRDDLAPFVEMNAKPDRPPSRRGWLTLDLVRELWPWAVKWWKPKTGTPGWRRRCLVKAGALIIAAIEKLDRAERRKGGAA